jgi:hypothetical protein
MVNQKDHDEQHRKEGVPARHNKAGVREEEVCQIYSLKKNLDYSDILIKYANKYLKMGWDLVAVNAQGEPAIDLDFQQPEEIWSSRLTSMGLAGLQMNLGVRTGRPSRLLVLEVHRDQSLAPFNQRGDWGSGCIAAVGQEREQHYYVVPRGWQPPPSYFLESFQIMVFGEEGMVLAPPSLEPQAQAALRWLRPPWENPPTRPSPALCKFLQDSAPAILEESTPSVPKVPTWAEIYPSITRYPGVLQALLAPAPHPEDYYAALVSAARQAGLADPEIILGLLWHAPLGDSSHLTRRWGYFQRLVREGAEGEQENDLSEPRSSQQSREPAFPAGPEDQKVAADNTNRDGSAKADGFAEASPPPLPPAASPRREEGRRRNGNGRFRLPEGEEYFDSWSELYSLSRDHLIVDRRRYEAMIYELGKLGAWQEFFKGQQRENKSLRQKIESQWAKELEYFRQMSARNEKKGWRKW